MEQMEQRKELFLAPEFWLVGLQGLPPHAFPLLLAWVSSLLLPVGVEIFLLLLISLPQSITDPYDSFSWPPDFLEEGRFLSISWEEPVGFKHSYILLAGCGLAVFTFPLSGGILRHARVILATYLAVVMFNNKARAVRMVYQ